MSIHILKVDRTRPSVTEESRRQVTAVRLLRPTLRIMTAIKGGLNSLTLDCAQYFFSRHENPLVGKSFIKFSPTREFLLYLIFSIY